MAINPASFIGPNVRGDTPENIARILQGVLNGKLNCITEVTLTANSATTAFAHPLIGAYSGLFFTPLSASAKTEGTPWISARADGTATLNHVNSATADRTYTVGIFG